MLKPGLTRGDSVPDPAAAEPLKIRYDGLTGPLFTLALKTGLLTLATLGLYRFWARSRIRRYVWSATAPGGEAMEYTGTGPEKLLGFLIAVIVLALVLGLAQIALAFAGLSLFAGDQTGGWAAGLSQLSFLLLLPLIWAAQYRAERYRLSRTRWRGIRFGMRPGAFGYMWRATLLTGVTVLSLGLLWPLRTFYLEKFRTDRILFGAGQLTQTGRWTDLYRVFWPLVAAIAILLPSLVVTGLEMRSTFDEILFDNPAQDGPPAPANTWLFALAPASATLGGICVGIAYLHYRVQGAALLARGKRLDASVSLTADPSTFTVLARWLAGNLVIGGALLAAVLTVALGVAGIFYAMMQVAGEGDGTSPVVNDWQALLPFAGLGLIVLVVLVLYDALRMALVTQPIYRHVVESLAIQNPTALETIPQRSRDGLADADGFADALDVGGAF